MLTGPRNSNTLLLFIITAVVICSVERNTWAADDSGAKPQTKASQRLIDAKRRDDELMYASANRSMEAVKLLVSQGANVNPKGMSHGLTPLTVAALKGRLDIVTFLIQHGAHVNANTTRHGHSGYLVAEGVGPQNPTPLGSAAEEGQTEVVEYLIKKGAKVNGQDGSSYTPLMWACAGSGNPETVKALLRHGANITLKTDLGETARSMALA